MAASPALRLRVRELREAAGLTQEELARRVGVRQATVSAMEQGAVRRVDLDVIERLAGALGVSPCAVLGGDDGADDRPPAGRAATGAR